MRRTLIWILALLLSGPAAAADLSSRYTEMGKMTAEIGDQVFELTIPYDVENERGNAEQKMIMGSFHTVNVVGQRVNEAGEPASPTLQVTLQEQAGALALLSAEVFDDRGYDEPLAMGADGGQGTLTSYTLEGDTLVAEVQGTFIRLTGYMAGDPKPASGEAELPAVIRWEVALPPLE